MIPLGGQPKNMKKSEAWSKKGFFRSASTENELLVLQPQETSQAVDSSAVTQEKERKRDIIVHEFNKFRAAAAAAVTAAAEAKRKPFRTEEGFLGLVVTTEMPHAVARVVDLVDVNSVRQGTAGYCNEEVCVGDLIIKIDDQDVTSVPLAKLQRLLRGELHSKVEITLSRQGKHAAAETVYSVLVLRHRYHEFGAAKEEEEEDDDDFEMVLAADDGDASFEGESVSLKQYNESGQCRSLLRLY